MTTSDQHFTSDAAGVPSGSGRFVDVSAIEPIRILPGLTFHPVAGESSLLNFVDYEENSEAPLHTHVEEQIVLVLEGQLEFTIDGYVRLLKPGDVVMIPPWVPHRAVTRDWTCRQIDIFTPPRATLVDHATAQIDRSRIQQ